MSSTTSNTSEYLNLQEIKTQNFGVYEPENQTPI